LKGAKEIDRAARPPSGSGALLEFLARIGYF
jgi:hypothetical protein